MIDHQRAYLVEREGQTWIKLDRPNEDIVRPFVPAEWIPDFERQPLTPHQVAQVAFEADKRLCVALGMHGKARKEWMSLKDEERIAWLNEGPAQPEIRHELYAAIMTALGGYA